MKAKCPKCKYEWESKSKLIFITCPSCMQKFKKDPTSKTNNKIYK